MRSLAFAVALLAFGAAVLGSRELKQQEGELARTLAFYGLPGSRAPACWTVVALLL